MRSQWGGDWPKLARDAAVGLSATAEEINPNPIGSLLLDIFVMFNRKKVDRMFTRDLVSGLNFQFISRPWMSSARARRSTTSGSPANCPLRH